MDSRVWMVTGADVELKGVEEGYVGGWFKVRIERLPSESCNEVYVMYENFHETSEPDSPHLFEVVRQELLRPIPPKDNRTCWSVREAVEAYYEEAWWEGFIRAYNKEDNTYIVYFGRSEPDLVFPPSMLRTRLDYAKPSHSRTLEWKKHAFMKDPPEWAWQDELKLYMNGREKQQGPKSKRSLRRLGSVSPSHLPQDSDVSWNEDSHHREVQSRKCLVTKRPGNQFKPKRGPGRPKKNMGLIKPLMKPKLEYGKQTSNLLMPLETSPASITSGPSPHKVEKQWLLTYPSLSSDKLKSSPSDALISHESAEIVQSTENLQGPEQIHSSPQYRAYISLLKALKFMGVERPSDRQGKVLKDVREMLDITRFVSQKAHKEVYGPRY